MLISVRSDRRLMLINSSVNLDNRWMNVCSSRLVIDGNVLGI